MKTLSDNEKCSFIKKSINESENLIDKKDGFLYCSARDLIFKNSEESIPNIDVSEIYLSNFLKNKLPININKDDIDKIKRICDSNHGYRILVYYLKGKHYGNIKWLDASDYIDNEIDYQEYIDPNSHLWEDYDYDEEFVKIFPTYESWIKFLNENARKEFIEELKSSSSPYEYLIDDIKINKDGIPYALIVWRA